MIDENNMEKFQQNLQLEPTSFRFIVMGDSRGSSTVVNETILRTLLNNINGLSVQPNFILFNGDMVYGSGNVESELTIWKDIVDDYYPITMYYPSIGNHEDNENAFSNSFNYLPSEQLQGYQRTAYYFDYDNSRFIILNSNRIDMQYHYVIDDYQLNWLENLLNNNGKTHNFVMFHVPAFPIGHHYGESLDANITQRNKLWSILDKYNVTAAFTAHEHNYNRRLVNSMFDNGGYKFVNQVNQITSGSAGAPLDASVYDSKNVIAGPFGVYHYVVVDVKDQMAIFDVYDRYNNRIDYLIVDKSNTNPPPSTYDTIVPAGDTWKYLDNGSDQGTAWCEPSFNDSTWLSGKAELGYGDGNEATVVSYGSNSSNKYITTYFRKPFNITDASIYKALILRLVRDDGAIVYLNGNEIYRSNMPSGIINYKTFASSALSGSDESTFNQITLTGNYLINGSNLLAVEIHQSDPYSSDISFNLELIGQKDSSSPPPVVNDIIIPAGSLWKYLDNGSNQGTAWFELSFNDLAWASGPAELGYGDGDEATVVSYGPRSSRKYITTYFRKSFSITDKSIYRGLTLKILRDDGAVVYLNGKEVFRTNMPQGTIYYRTLAASSVDVPEEKTFKEVTLASDLLTNGDNIVAVEIHQASSSNTDLSFNLELIGTRDNNIL